MLNSEFCAKFIFRTIQEGHKMKNNSSTKLERYF